MELLDIYGILKAEGETRLRFEDYLEMAMIEGELANGAQAIAGT